MKIKIGVLLLFVCIQTAEAQNEALYSQYMFNIQAFNPAYTGSWNNPGFTLISRQQWSDFENNPSSNALSFQYPFANNTGMGLSLLNDNLGKQVRNSLYLDYAFGIKINKNTKLRMGLKGGIINYSNNFSGFVLINNNDPAFINDQLNIWHAGLGIGTFIHNNKMYAGFSIPSMLNYENTYSISASNMAFISGIVIPLSQGIDFKPSVNILYHNTMPLIADINLSFLFADRVWIGAMYRTSDDLNIGFNINFLIGNNLRVAYAYDMMQNTGLNAFSTGTHEIMLSYELNLKTYKFTSPRYF